MADKKRLKVKNVILTLVCMIFLGGIIFLLDFLGICDLTPLIKFRREEKKRRKEGSMQAEE